MIYRTGFCRAFLRMISLFWQVYWKKSNLPLATIVSEPDQSIPYILFPEAGLLSVIVATAKGGMAEGALVGREGFATPAIMLGTDRVPHSVEVQIEGYGYKIDTGDFIESTAKSETLRMTLLRFVQALNVQSTYTAASNAVHSIEQRLARWLLMCHDRSQSDDLALTHKFISIMLTVRRASVTTAVQTLEGQGLIQSDRGYITILKRAALEAFAGEAYGQPEAEYRRLLGPL